jgi:two-component sensor histidine kinase
VEWSLRDCHIHLLWREVAAPHLSSPPSRASFGTRLIDSIFEEQLGGRITRHWEPTGLVCDIVFPAHPD